MRSEHERALAAGLLVVVLAGCSQPLRRWFSADCGPAQPCTEGQCIEAKCARPCTASTDCGDGLCFHDVCVPPDYACSHGACEDGNACTIDECNIETGACRYRAGTTCFIDLCTAGAECVACAGPNSSKPGGDCVHGWQCKGAAKCDDGDPATTDTCDPATGSCSNVK